MSLGSTFVGTLQATGQVPATVSASDAAGRCVEADVTSVDQFSSVWAELRLNLPELAQHPFAKVQNWGAQICQKVTYLLEQIGPLELDSQAQQVLIRSIPPDQKPGEKRFYELLLHGGGSLTLCRYRAVTGQPRERIDIVATHEVAEKLVDDFVAAAANV